METPQKAVASCSGCRSPLGADGRCLPCLLRGGLPEETLVESSPMSPAPPLVIDPDATVYGDFEVARRDDGSLWELGRGAMGVTYRAVDRVLHRPVALKVIQLGTTPARDSDWSNALRERFLREARAAAALRHANIAGVFQFGAADKSGRCYYVMELVEGETLETRVRRDGPLDADTTLGIASQVAAALVAAAGRGLIHRDLKPSNLMLTDGGPTAELEVKVIDFGLAKAAATAGEADLTHGGFVGTPAFASPEQFERRPVDARTDIYSLGVTLWYALTGQAPFTGRNLDELRHHPARAVLPMEQLTAKKVPPALVALLRAMLAENPAERPASARELVAALENCRRLSGVDRGRPLSGERRPVLATTSALLLALGFALAGTGFVWWASRRPQPTVPVPAASVAVAPAPLAIPEKSLAVLPFDNFSTDKDSAFFADGVQDEVLTDLAKVADLKVISRSSVMQYKKTDTRNLREIGRTLDVAYVVEGSVQRAGNQIKVTAQLIDARTDTHHWAETYVRDLSDVFTIQSEIAQAIAGQLRAAVSPLERAEMEEVPTHDEQAYQLYLRARAVWNDNDTITAEEMRTRTLDLLRQATARDPNFARAFAFLAEVQFGLFGENTTPADGEAARGYAETVARLRPGSADANVAMGCYDFFIRHDNARAHEEFTAALRLAPNDERAYSFLSRIEMKQGRYAEALAHQRRASELDPENNPRFWSYCGLLSAMGHTSEALALIDRRIASRPTDIFLHGLKAQVLLNGKADTRAARAEIACVPPAMDLDGWVTSLRLACDYYDRDFAAAARDLAASSLEVIGGTPRAECEADIARLRGDAKAAAFFTEARAGAEKRARDDPNDRSAFNNLALYDAFLGHKEAALEESRRMRSLVQPDEAGMAAFADYMRARVLVLVGEREESIRVLQTVCGIPSGAGYGDLHDPDWDPLRGDPRFQAMVASLAPK